MPRTRYSFTALGTHWTIDIEDTSPTTEGVFLEQTIKERLETYEQTYSRFRASSWLRQCGKPGTYTLPPDAYPLFSLYEKIYTLTNGAVTPLIGATLHDLGYDEIYSLTPRTTIRRPPSWRDALELTRDNLIVKQPVHFDVGGLGKGYAIDIISELLLEHHMTSWCVEAGGDMRYAAPSPTPLRVGLEHPLDTTQAIGIAEIPSGYSICGSAGNRRAWNTYHHIVNPITLTSPHHILAIWVVAHTTLLADALTSALFFTPADQLRTHFDFEYVLLFADYSLEKSPHFPGELFT